MANDTWRTPPEIFNHYNNQYNFVCDVCASEENALHESFLTEAHDFLTFNTALYANAGEYVWCNPPYSKPLPFVKRCIEISKDHGVGSVLLLNFDASTKWFDQLIQYNVRNEIFIGGRVAFLDANNIPVKNNPKGQFACVIPPFCRHSDCITEYIELEYIMSVELK